MVFAKKRGELEGIYQAQDFATMNVDINVL